MRSAKATRSIVAVDIVVGSGEICFIRKSHLKEKRINYYGLLNMSKAKKDEEINRIKIATANH
jgi:hypothetical protein